ncbi:hypothetical protein C8R45DRAFT_929460 [Mycena sanguinolenta]|nr:hypothetical protein C8R45DRAFT_929460 [Mycena sanguinolenta]
MLDFAQPYPGDLGVIDYSEPRFTVFNKGDEYVIMDREFLEDLTIKPGVLRDPDFMPALWYAQQCAIRRGIDPEAPREVDRYLEEVGDAYTRALKMLLTFYFCAEDPGNTPMERFEICPEGDWLVISDREEATCVHLPRELLLNPKFALFTWYEEAVSQLDFGSSSRDFLSSESSENSRYDTCDESEPMPSLYPASDSSKSESTGSESSEDAIPGLIPGDNSSDEDSDIGDPTRLVMIGDNGETMEDRLKYWAHVASELPASAPRPEPVSRSHRIGDVLGDTIAALLEFFKPYPGDIQIPWTDEREAARRFRVMRASEESYVIDDSWFDWATPLPMELIRSSNFYLLEWYARAQAKSLGIEYLRASPIHHFPVEEILADAIQQYFRDVSREIPGFAQVTIERILREPEDNEGPDIFLIISPLGSRDLHEIISEQTLLNPDLNLVNWVHRRRLKCLLRENSTKVSQRDDYLGALFDLPEPEMEGEFFLHCGGVQIPADSVKGISRTASMPRISDRVVARPLVIVISCI